MALDILKKGKTMYSREQIEKTWSDFEEAQKVTMLQLRNSCPTARDTQGHMGNAITFIGTDLMMETMDKMKETFFGLLDKPRVVAQQKNDKTHKALERLGVRQ